MSGLDLYLSQRDTLVMCLVAALVGLLLGVLYDLLFLVRLLLEGPDRPSTLQDDDGQASPRRPHCLLALHLFLHDTLFVVAAAAALVLLLYYTNDGQFRAPAVMGMACGFFVYGRTVGHLFRRVASPLVAGLRWLIRSTCALVGAVCAWLCTHLVLRPLRALWRHTGGLWLARYRLRRTEGRINTLVRHAAQGFAPEATGRKKRLPFSHKHASGGEPSGQDVP